MMKRIAQWSMDHVGAMIALMAGIALIAALLTPVVTAMAQTQTPLDAVCGRTKTGLQLEAACTVSTFAEDEENGVGDDRAAVTHTERTARLIAEIECGQLSRDELQEAITAAAIMGCILYAILFFILSQPA